MKATFDPAAKTKFTTSHRKEGKCFFNSYSIVTLDSAENNPQLKARTPVELRCYGTGAKNFACLWVNASPLHASGSGSAGGYGYHRTSAAVSEAIQNAGFTLSESIGGVGEGAIRDALCAIADCLNLKDYALVESYA